MLIALEGCDGVGKSTLAQDIVDRIKHEHPDDEVHLLHAGPLKTDPYTAYLEPLKDYRPDSGVHYILDRWHVGETIYGPLYREKSAFDDPTWIWLELWFASRGLTLIHVTQTLEEIKRRLEERGEDFLQPEHVEHVWREFGSKTRQSLNFSMKVEPDGDNGDYVDEIIARARINEVITRKLPKSYVGSPYASILLVGEKRGGKPPYEFDGAFRPVSGNSGAFLWQAIANNASEHYGYSWRDYAAINADPGEEPELVKALDSAFIAVVLGGEAFKHYQKTVITQFPKNYPTLFRLPHPQYIRRFHNKRLDEYGQILANPMTHAGEDLSKWPNS